jgi:hypothetical protein
MNILSLQDLLTVTLVASYLSKRLGVGSVSLVEGSSLKSWN